MPIVAVPFLILAAVIVVSWTNRQRARATTDQTLRESWGKIAIRPRNLDAVAAFYRRRVAEDPSVAGLDDRTWADLTMDDLFGLVDRTDSLIGRQHLYSQLRTVPAPAALDAFDALATCIGDDVPARLTTRRALLALGDSADAAELMDFTAPDVVQTRAWYAVFPLIGVLMVIGLVATAWWPPAIFLVAAGTLVNLGLRATVATDLRLAGRAFRQIAPLLTAAEAIAAIDGPAWSILTGALGTDTATLAPLRRVSGWVGRDASASASGELGALIIEYFNMALCLDGNALYFGGRYVREHRLMLRRVVGAVGAVDAASSVASYRAGAGQWTRPAFRPEGTSSELVDVRHPLVPDAVPSSITLGPPHGIVVTGSNMSGKSTFLRTIGVSAVMAQAIATCTASRYEAPRLIVRTCIGQADDPATGKSYYLVEVDSVLSLVSAAASGLPHLFLFDELFRGTNAVERIAAGEAVLWALLDPPPAERAPAHIVIAATHDQELVELLAARYRPFHFADRLDEGSLTFDYQLRPGSATTRNAIALLGLRGAPDALVSRALAHAAELDARREAIVNDRRRGV